MSDTPRNISLALQGVLIDQRPALKSAMTATAEHTGVNVRFRSSGSILNHDMVRLFKHFFKDEQARGNALAFYQSFLATNGPREVKATSGAKEVLTALHEQGWRTVVVGIKIPSFVLSALRHLELPIDDLRNSIGSHKREETLVDLGPSVLVSTGTTDMALARSIGAHGIALKNSETNVTRLREAGAGIIIDSLYELPAALPSLETLAD